MLNLNRPNSRRNTFAGLALLVALLSTLTVWMTASTSSGQSSPEEMRITVYGLARDGVALEMASPTSTPIVVYAECTTNYGDWSVELSRFHWPFREACAVLLCESGGNPRAVSRSGAIGLFQIHPGHSSLFVPAANIAAAYAKYQDGVRRGNPWYHWNQFGHCGWF